MNLFKRANSIGANFVTQWLPNGKNEHGEWTALNPTREDNTAGSFKVNLKSGAWIDNATDDKGGDFVSLYAYIFADKCRAGSYGAIQVAAAKNILLDHDPDYFPSDSDDFTPPKKSASYDRWAGFHYVTYKLDNVPEINTSWYEDKWGKVQEKWQFYKKDRLVMTIVRFIDGKQKQDKPFTLWAKSDKIDWRCKAPQEDYPLWNLNEILEDRDNRAIVLCEGQKAASRGKACADLSNYIFTGWYGGAKNTKLTDWSPLRGRTVYFWHDADTPGREAIKRVNEIAQIYDIELKIVHPPVGVPKGWDLADAIAQGENIEELLNPPNEPDSTHFIDDLKLPFDIVGTSGSDIIFYCHGSNRVEKYKASALTKNALMTLADREMWGKYYTKEGGGIAWEAAINDVIRRADLTPVFDFTKVRGAGAWKDGNDIVINTGEYLLVNQEKKELHERVGEYVYEKKGYIPYRINNPLETENAKTLIKVLTEISWTNKVAPYALAGWIALSPWGGLLRWRPHVWIIGPSGSGKSTVIEKVIGPFIVNEFGVRGDGLSTASGMRQKLANSSLPMVGDEFESDNPKEADNINHILKMFRSSSSGTEGAAILMGTADGQGQRFVVQSMALFASIGAAIKHGADLNRFTICELATPRKKMINERKKNFLKTEKAMMSFTKEYVRAFHARTYNHIDEVLKCIDIFKSATTDITQSMRDGDQLGTLLAGAYMIIHDKSATAAEAKQFLESLDIQNCFDNSMKTDEEQCLDEILAVKIHVENRAGKMDISLGGLIDQYINYEENGVNVKCYDDDILPALTRKSMDMALAQAGYKMALDSDGYWVLYIAKGHTNIKRALRGTAWENTYIDMLKRLENVTESKSNTRFAGQQKRYLILNLKGLYDNEISF